MSIFEHIDDKLIRLATKPGATLTKDRPGYPEGPITFEERRIDWIDGQMKKAIIIQPAFEVTGVNCSQWSLVNLAWVERNGVPVKPSWKMVLIEKSDFHLIEINIDELLLQSEINLTRVHIQDSM